MELSEPLSPTQLDILFGAGTALRRREDIFESTYREGRASFNAGMGVAECPPFVDDDMTIGWRMGWRHASEARARRSSNTR